MQVLPDTEGTGAYPAEKKIMASLDTHTVYLPKDLAGLQDKKLGILLFGNGGCSGNGASSRNHLLEIASHGFLAIAPGRIYSGPGSEPRPAPVIDPVMNLPKQETTYQDLLTALDWALAQNQDPESELYAKLDSEAVAVSGWSCGGVQAIKVAPDSRIKTVVLHNTGTFPDSHPFAKRMDISKQALASIHTPVIYLIGGPEDIAYENALDDFSKIDHVPAVMANLQVGHLGTFNEANGGRVAQVTLDWLQWQLYGDEAAGRTFTGRSCRMCLDPTWTIQRKGL
ncbi:hypothetical protein BFC17_12750 [Alteromonas lipolytica]|uniref:Dienelactone hydrolase domain-containing protein n=2 Tax=Alteromonas lipolytica TaxID=1856405 RepID=A0A1E8FJB6_9ALTE|nr:hypothetical protein BFC17_12750 [Alteromonas lipolytica]